MHNWSIPSPAPSFFSTTTTLKVYRLLDSSMTLFWSIIWICSFIHLYFLNDQWPCFYTTEVSSKSLIAYSIIWQFSMSWAPWETISSYFLGWFWELFSPWFPLFQLFQKAWPFFHLLDEVSIAHHHKHYGITILLGYLLFKFLHQLVLHFLSWAISLLLHLNFYSTDIILMFSFSLYY